MKKPGRKPFLTQYVVVEVVTRQECLPSPPHPVLEAARIQAEVAVAKPAKEMSHFTDTS